MAKSLHARLRTAAALLSALLCCAVGCKNEKEYGEVEGAVTLEGKPLANVEVVFLPDPEKGSSGRRSIALTDAQGRYRVTSDAGRAGAPVGFHRVCVNDLLARPPRTGNPAVVTDGNPAAPAGTTTAPAKPQRPSGWRFPIEYGSATATPLRDIEVRAGTQTIDLRIKMK